MTQQLSDLINNRKPQKTKAKCQHQAMMEMVINAGYAPKKYQARWGKWIKQSGINDTDLQRLITAAEVLRDRYDPRGIVRNALIRREWTNYF